METKTDTRGAAQLSIGGAVVAALAASSCCLGPLLLAALGVGGAGAFGAMGALRPYILAGTAALLATGFYLSYRRPNERAADACGCAKPNRAGRSVSRLGLWIATSVVVLVAAAPPLLARIDQLTHHAAPVAPFARLETTRIHVQGIDCEGCAAPIRKALNGVGGFHDLRLDIPAQQVAITYEPAEGRLAAYAKAIEDATGYEVALP